MSKVTAAQEEMVLEALTRRCTHVEAASAAGISSKSVQRLLARPDFASRLAQGMAVRLLDYAARLDDMEDVVMAAIRDAMAPDNRVADRLHGVDCWARQRGSVRASFDFEARLQALERRDDDEDEGDPSDISPVSS